MTDGAPTSEPNLDPTPDERAAMRAFLQRCEVRLSTLHRVATALLSGAGILVLLPAVSRDAVTGVMRALLPGPITLIRGLLAAAVAVSILAALAVLWYVLVELTRFYFHANLIDHGDGKAFTPRFTLTGLRIPRDELGGPTNEIYDEVHGAPRNVRLLVPPNAKARRRIDRQLAAYPSLRDGLHATNDSGRAEALLELAAARRRSLVDEVAKVEYGIARHMLRLQVIVLRYVKALLAVITTALATYACAAALSGEPVASLADQRWIAGAMLIWAPTVMFVVTAPVHWLESLLRAEGATHTALRRDPQLVRLEDATARIATVSWVASLAAMGLLLAKPVTMTGRVFSIVVALGSAGACGLLLLSRVRAARAAHTAS